MEQFFGEYNDRLVGLMLTVVEAAIADKAQREAAKSLVKRLLYDLRDQGLQQLRALEAK